MRKSIVFVTHKPKQCGVYEFGKNVFNAILQSEQYRFIKIESDSIKDLEKQLDFHKPDAVIYNYHPSVMPWLATKISKGIYRNNIAGKNYPQIGIIHEITQEVADNATGYGNKLVIGQSQKKLNSLFDFYIAPDPTLFLKNPLVFKTGRLIPKYKNLLPTPEIPTIGSFGFGTPNKGFEKLVAKVQEEFTEAVIRLNIPSADFGDPNGLNATKIADNCRAIINNENITIEVSHKFLNDEALLDFLASNSINAFLYEDTGGRGLSSTVDNALAVNRPIAVSQSSMFRHILNQCPSVSIQKSSLKKIINNGTNCLEELSKDWNEENLCWNYNRILKVIFDKIEKPVVQKRGIVKTIRSIWNKAFSLPDESFTWLTNTKAASEDDLSRNNDFFYKPVDLNGQVLNRILDDNARLLYRPTIEALHKLVPITMAKKIERANVQQAFVFDTVYHFSSQYENPKLLSVGSYEDTASMSLRKLKFEVYEIDPMINYFLQDYFEKPSTKKNYYDIIFSTSVIEHDPDDKSFIECIEGLLAPGGFAVITCDYKDGWKAGDPKPPVDERFYTKYDLQNRLPSYLQNSELVDTPQWDCPHPDFNYLGKYQYTFATFVFRKQK
ncbi:MAG: methyltransferase domain-containing protein [Ginsengibacter sp.]